MDARGGGKVQGNVSAVAGFMLPRPQPQKAGRQDLADLGQALGGGHKVRVEGVGHVMLVLQRCCYSAEDRRRGPGIRRESVG
jgi:hypothetical protein